MRHELAALEAIDSEIARRKAADNPLSYGLPDLLRPQAEGESDEEFIDRQNSELRTFVESLWIVKDSKRIDVKLAPKMVDFLADLFYRRESQAILWKGRGTGGTLCTAILVWMCLVFRKMSFTAMAGSSEQAKQIYTYTKSFWSCFPELARNMLDGDPLQSETRLKNGTILKIISASEKQARGKHNPGFIVDESCQEGDGVDKMITAGMQGAMSENEYMVVLLSTFHHPIGLFQETWDYAEERGFARYTWDVYDAMAPCDAGMETATEKDPQAIGFCRMECTLTEKIEDFDDLGERTGWRWKGCNGRARTARGFMPRRNVMTAKKLNKGTNVFQVEFENERPNWMRPVYAVEWIEASYVEDSFPPPGTRVLDISAGIDWGLEGQTAVILTALLEVTPAAAGITDDLADKLGAAPWRCVAVLDAEFMTGQLTPEVLRILWGWVEVFGQENFHVYADASHPYNNLEVDQAGFDLNAVKFAVWKDFGIGNITRFFTNRGRLKVRQSLTGLTGQLKRYRLNKVGKPIKKDDHGPDALLCAMLHYNFEEMFAEDLEVTPEELAPAGPIEALRKGVMPKFEGAEAPATLRFAPRKVDLPENVEIKRKSTSDGQVVVL